MIDDLWIEKGNLNRNRFEYLATKISTNSYNYTNQFEKKRKTKMIIIRLFLDIKNNSMIRFSVLETNKHKKKQSSIIY